MPNFPPSDVDAKDPSDITIYTLDWTSQVNAGATITSSTWAISPASLTKAADGIVIGNLKTSIKVSGGVAGVDYIVTNTIQTSDGETKELSGVIRVRNL